jgi:hypothetical protein
MDRQIENVNVKEETKPSAYNSGHLMCRTSWWGVAGFLGCAYFAWLSFIHVARDDYDWPHDEWTAATYIVWILLLIILVVDTRCLRERLFFGVLVINFVIGCGLTFWYNVTSAEVRTARIATGSLWAAAALLSLSTLGRESEIRKKETRKRIVP